MILNTAPQDEAILSNVGEIGGFKIKASAKAFSILSSGLYANKIRAIIRELSCNAVDSHTAAGKQGVPFEVHLPNTFAPHFSVRDFGTGLSHDQVTNIYTTYFESTKTNSNSYIGALGLGSKSPFSYTDNFTVTAIKDGRKGVYTAFINNDGVPSIALMIEETTNEANGVEVKFAVQDKWDFSKFADEARTVFTHFSLRPKVIGQADFEFRNVEYETRDIIPGVHSVKNGGGYHSKAVMGNIAYTIEVPNSEDNLGDLESLLNCCLEFNFDIGELDFQASREGLSYVPQTIEAIKKKLIAVNDALTSVLAKEADAISNLWERVKFLEERAQTSLWRAAVIKYVADTKFELMKEQHGSVYTNNFPLYIDDLAKKFNIHITTAFSKATYRDSCSRLSSYAEHFKDPKDPTKTVTRLNWGFKPSLNVALVINDTKLGVGERAKNHWKTHVVPTGGKRLPSEVYILDKDDKTKEMDIKGFLAFISSPPADQVFLASTLREKTRATTMAKNVSLMKLEERGYYREREQVWKDAGTLSSLDDTKTYYYLPLKGFEVQSGHSYTSAHELYRDLKDSGLTGLIPESIYGVRKTHHDTIKSMKNWINVEQYVLEKLTKQDPAVLMSLAAGSIDNFDRIKYNSNIATKVTNSNSPYLVLSKKTKGVTATRHDSRRLQHLCTRFIPKNPINPDKVIKDMTQEAKDIFKRYPLLESIRSDAPSGAVAEYINMIDAQKGV